MLSNEKLVSLLFQYSAFVLIVIYLGEKSFVSMIGELSTGYI